MKRRNQILIAWLKPQLKSQELKPIKNEIKRMISFARTPSGNLEERLNDLYLQVRSYEKKLTDANRLFNLLKLIEAENGLLTKIYEPESNALEEEAIYVLHDHIEHCFDESGNQVAPISLLVNLQSNDQGVINLLLETISKSGLFNSELLETSTNQSQYHIVLHPVS